MTAPPSSTTSPVPTRPSGSPPSAPLPPDASCSARCRNSAAAEVKRLYVRPAFRGLGLAHALMQAAEEHARAGGLEWLYLDTKDDLHAAIHFYLGTGYQPCPRYNDNPQATLFLRKQL